MEDNTSEYFYVYNRLENNLICKLRFNCSNNREGWNTIWYSKIRPIVVDIYDIDTREHYNKGLSSWHTEQEYIVGQTVEFADWYYLTEEAAIIAILKEQERQKQQQKRFSRNSKGQLLIEEAYSLNNMEQKEEYGTETIDIMNSYLKKLYGIDD